MKTYLILTFGILMLFNNIYADCEHIYLKGKLKAIIIPILKERISEYKDTYDSNGNIKPREDYDSLGNYIEYSKHNLKLDTLFENVLEIKNKYTNEILAILLGIYFGEHQLEEIECEIINRGSQMLPYLLRYKDKCISRINGIDIPDKIILKEDIQRHYEENIKEIKLKHKCNDKEE